MLPKLLKRVKVGIAHEVRESTSLPNVVRVKVEDTNGGANGEDEVERILTEVNAFRRGSHLWFFVDGRSNFSKRKKTGIEEWIMEGEWRSYSFMF